MRIEDVCTIEQPANHCIHLFKSSIFWKAFETSAYLFSVHFKPYQVLAHYYKNVGKRVVYLGFPDSTLGTILNIATAKGFQHVRVDPSHYIIENVPNPGDFHQWKAHHAENISTESDRKDKAKVYTRHSADYLFKRLYEFSLYILNLAPKVDKRYKFTLAEPLASDAVELCKAAHSVANGSSKSSHSWFQEKLYGIQVEARLLASLRQISLRQLRYINQTLSTILEITFPASESSRTSGGIIEESSTPPQPVPKMHAEG